MTSIAMSYTDFALPWASSRKEDERFKRILKRLLLLLLLLALVFPWLPLPTVEREEAERIPPALAKVILQQKLPAPPPPAAQEQPVEKKETAAQKKKVEQARQKVASMGVAAFSNQLKSLRSSLDVAKLQAHNTNIATGAAARTTRSVLGRDSATQTSGGFDTSVMSSDGGGTELAGRNGVEVGSPFGEVGGSGAGGGGKGGKHGSSVAGGRDMESIRRVFEQHKGAIYAIYNRALRQDPEIKGKFVFHIVIEPSGAISAIELVSSELETGDLERKLLARIRVIDFGPADAIATPVNYKFDFLPG